MRSVVAWFIIADGLWCQFSEYQISFSKFLDIVFGFPDQFLNYPVPLSREFAEKGQPYRLFLVLIRLDPG